MSVVAWISWHSEGQKAECGSWRVSGRKHSAVKGKKREKVPFEVQGNVVLLLFIKHGRELNTLLGTRDGEGCESVCNQRER